MRLSKKNITEGIVVGIVIAILTTFLITPIRDFIWGDSSAKDKQRYNDSVADAKANEKIRDSVIEKEILEKRLIDADQKIDNYVTSMAGEIDPLTHERESYSIDTVKATYNKYTQLVTIPFTIDWYGAVYYYTTGKNPIMLHELTGELLYYGDGTYQIKPLSLNDALATDIKETNSLNDGLDKLQKIGKLFSGNNSTD